MAVYYSDMDYSLRDRDDIKHTLKADVITDYFNNRSKIVLSIIRTKTGNEKVYNNYAKIKYVVNGQTVTDEIVYNAIWIGTEECQKTIYCNHDANGCASISINADLECDKGSKYGITKYWTHCSTSITLNAEQIDQSNPTINSCAISGNRYGLNVSANFSASHNVYPLKELKFKIWGMTYSQANNRAGRVSGGYGTSSLITVDNSYGVMIEMSDSSHAMSKEISVEYNLDGALGVKYPLNSGGSYLWSLTVTALNGKQAQISGTLRLPQKVTGITADSSLDIIQGKTEQISYFVAPSNAELQSVSFISSDTGTATVDENGIVTAVSDGICAVTVTTEDGGFSAETVINVVDTSRFPELNYFTDYLSIVDVSRIIFACTFLSDELKEHGATVDELITISIQGKSQPINYIRGIFSDIESNCQKLRDAAVSAGFIIDSLPKIRLINKTNADWIIVVNGWIDLLNEIYIKINGGD